MNKQIKMSKKDLFLDLYKDQERKSFLQIIRELITLSIYHGSLPRLYFSRYLFKKETTNIKDYVPNKFLAFDLKNYFIDEAAIEVLENKLYFSFFYSQFNIKMPEILMYNHKNMFVAHNKHYQLKDSKEFKHLLEKLFSNNPSHDSVIVKRTYWSNGGDKIYKIYRDQLFEDDSTINTLFKAVIEDGFLFQETVKQHEKINLINSSCLNTIRMDTFVDKNGKVEVISAYLRMSTNNAHIDNISTGGCYVGINLENGCLKKYGYTPFTMTGSDLLTRHPISKMVFDNYPIPYFEEAKELIIKTASFVPGLRLVGWDIAIGESGPVLIEGNSRYMAAANDLTEGGYWSNSVFQKMVLEIQEAKKII